MSLTDEQRNIMVQLLIEKSDRNMEQALKNRELEYWDLVANRLYYSVFHAVTALMLTDGIKTSTHKGTSSQFGQHYVLTGKFSRVDGMLYSRLQTMREKADYQNVFTMSDDIGNQLIQDAMALQQRILREIKAH
ncbi:MAG: HEPN domain-containing protein [Duncaniella sp.]|nr:HEPN domain-containing protein [Duncaniella sp.]